MSDEVTIEPRADKWRRERSRALDLGIGIIAIFYLMALLADFLAPYDYREQVRQMPNAPPGRLHLRDATGDWQMPPFIYQQRLVDPLTRRYQEDRARKFSVEFFVPGYRYHLFGLIPLDRHLFGVRGGDGDETARLNLLGADALGRDRFSRLLIAARFSLIVAPLATLLAGALGLLIGCLAGYGGRWLDAVLMRTTDLMLALPTLLIVLAARAVFPLELPPSRAGLLLVGCFVALGWAEMARLVRGLVGELRTREFILAAVGIGLSPARVMLRHILPNAAPAILAQLCLMLPTFLLAETALSFLGVGLQEPEASWGTMLVAASDLTQLEGDSSWTLLAPAAAIMLFVFGLRLLGRELEKRA
jgi:peptide/nickel transport system permease protein